MLFNEYFGDIGALAFFIYFVVAMDKHNDVGILFDGTGVAEVGKAWFATALLNGTRQLRERNDGHIKLAR